MLGEELYAIDNLTNALDKTTWLGRMRLWINAKEKSLPQPQSEPPAAGLSHEDGRRQKASFMTAEYAKLTRQGKKAVRTELGLVPKSTGAPGTAGPAANAAPAPVGPKSCVFQDGARFQASRQMAGDHYVGKMMVLPAHIQPGTGSCPKCRGTHPEVCECPNVAAERGDEYNQEYH